MSAVFGCTILHALLGGFFTRCSDGPVSALIGAVLSCVVRIVTYWLNYVVLPYTTFGATFNPFWHFVPTVYIGYLAGFFTARLVNHLPADGRVRTWFGWKFVDLLALALYLYFFEVRLQWSFWDERVASMCFPLFCLFCFLCACKHHGPSLCLLGFPALASLGPSSYATYLVQPLWQDVLYFSRWAVQITALIVLVGGSFLSGAAIHYYVERPAARYLKPLADDPCACCDRGRGGETGSSV